MKSKKDNKATGNLPSSAFYGDGERGVGARNLL